MPKKCKGECYNGLNEFSNVVNSGVDGNWLPDSDNTFYPITQASSTYKYDKPNAVFVKEVSLSGLNGSFLLDTDNLENITVIVNLRNGHYTSDNQSVYYLGCFKTKGVFPFNFSLTGIADMVGEELNFDVWQKLGCDIPKDTCPVPVDPSCIKPHTQVPDVDEISPACNVNDVKVKKGLTFTPALGCFGTYAGNGDVGNKCENPSKTKPCLFSILTSDLIKEECRNCWSQVEKWEWSPSHVTHAENLDAWGYDLTGTGNSKTSGVFTFSKNVEEPFIITLNTNKKWEAFYFEANSTTPIKNGTWNTNFSVDNKGNATPLTYSTLWKRKCKDCKKCKNCNLPKSTPPPCTPGKGSNSS